MDKIYADKVLLGASHEVGQEELKDLFVNHHTA
jgi:hypothetical protein